MKEIKRLLPVIGITIFTLVISLLLYYEVMERETERCWRELGNTAQAVNREINTKLEDEAVKLHLIEEIMIQDNIRGVEDIGLLHLDLVKTTTIFSRIDILFPDNVLVTDGVERKLETIVDFDRVAEKGEYITRRKLDTRTGKQCVYYVLPVMKEKEVLAVLIGMLEPEVLSEAFMPIYYNGQISICMIDSADGSYIMDTWHSELGNIYETGYREKRKGYEDIDIQEEMINLNTGTVAFESKTTGKTLYMYYTPVGMFGWQLAIFAPEDVLFSNQIALRRVFLFAGIVEAVVLILYFVWNIRTVHLLERGNEEISRQKEELKHISYRDMLTSMYNRNKYSVVLEALRGQVQEKIGVAYIDLNGLKRVNDTQSHEAGDNYIRNTAKIISDIFYKKCYRIGGDEFVIIVPEMEQTDFEERIAVLRENMRTAHISIAIGFVWEEVCEDIQKLLKKAEKQMYADKEQYYRTHDRRR